MSCIGPPGWEEEDEDEENEEEEDDDDEDEDEGGVGHGCTGLIPRPCRLPAEKSTLTVDAVKLHNELQSGSLRSGRPGGSAVPLPMEEEEDGEAATERSSGTFLSGLSDCTNVTFSKVQRFWESSSAAHKEVLGDTGLGAGVPGGIPLHRGRRPAPLGAVTDLCGAGGRDGGDPLAGGKGDGDGVLCCAGEWPPRGAGTTGAAAGSLGALPGVPSSHQMHRASFSCRGAVGLLLVSLSPFPRLWEGLCQCKPYFCSQMTTLEAVDTPESLAAVAYLLNLVLKR